MMLNAIVPIWKPADWTSFDVVRKVRPQVRPSKVGHAGTLDPFATGVLVLCIGSMTAQVESLMELEKEYEAVVRLGQTTDTLDPTGQVTAESAVPPFTDENLKAVFARFTGTISQIPPMYSALKKNGVPLYKLARKGISVEREPRQVNIHGIELLERSSSGFRMRIACGRGTYIRSLAGDIAGALGTLGYVAELTRTRVGSFDRSVAIEIDNFPEWLSTAA